MLASSLLAALILSSAPEEDPGPIINVNGPCTIVIRSNGDMILSNGKEISEPIPDTAMASAERIWEAMGCMGR